MKSFYHIFIHSWKVNDSWTLYFYEYFITNSNEKEIIVIEIAESLLYLLNENM